MPAAPLWIHRLPDALPALASLPQDLVDRRTLEELLGVGKWTAWRILRQCGAEDGPGGALVCRRERLVERLRAIRQDGRLPPAPPPGRPPPSPPKPPAASASNATSTACSSTPPKSTRRSPATPPPPRSP